MRTVVLYFALLLLFVPMVRAQEILTVEQAVQLALKNNYDIRIAQNDSVIARENKSFGNAGMLPKVDLTLNQNNVIQNTKQTQSNGEVRELDDAKNNSLAYGVNLGWTVFDGLRMFARYDQLKELEKQGQLQLKMTVLTKVSDVVTAYYDLVQQQQLLKALDTTIVISKQRVKTADNRFTIGKAAKLEVLNAQVDLNTDSSNFLRQKELFEISKIRLNELLARDVQTEFSVKEELKLNKELKLDELKAMVEKQNPQLQLAITAKRVAELDLKQLKANRFPTVKLNTGYNFNRSESSLGFTSQSSARGLNYGVSASLTVFNGFLQNRNEKIARLMVDNSKIALEQQRQTLQAQLAAAYQTYVTNLQLAALEGDNEAIAKRNLDITLEKFKIGTIATLEFRTAQENYIAAIARNSSAKFQAKISEVLLQEIAGNISLQ